MDKIIALPPTRDDYFQPVKLQLNLSGYRIKPRPQEAQKTDQRAESIAPGSRKPAVAGVARRPTHDFVGRKTLDDQGIVVGGRADIGLSFAHLERFSGQLRALCQLDSRANDSIGRRAPFASISRGTGIRVFVAFPILDDDRLLGVVLLSRTPHSILEHLYNQKEKVAFSAAIVLLLAVVLGRIYVLHDCAAAPRVDPANEAVCQRGQESRSSR